LVVSISLLAGGGGSNTTADVAGLVEAYVGQQADDGSVASTTTIDVSGAIDIEAKAEADNASTQATVGVGGAFLAVGALFATSTIGADAGFSDSPPVGVRAYAGKGTRIGSSRRKAGSLGISATSTASASSFTLVAGGGLLAGLGAKATTNVQPAISAYIAQGVTADLAGDLVIDATSTRAEGDATAKAFGGGGVAVGVPIAEVNTNPVIRSYIDNQAIVNAGGNVAVTAHS